MPPIESNNTNFHFLAKNTLIQNTLIITVKKLEVMENMEFIDNIRTKIDDITYEQMMPYENKTIIETLDK
jgi:hypothetical protein